MDSVKFEQNKEAYIDTPIGRLLVYATDPDYPGFAIDLELPNKNRIGVCLVESNAENNGELTTYVYGDGQSEEYTQRIVHKNY